MMVMHPLYRGQLKCFQPSCRTTTTTNNPVLNRHLLHHHADSMCMGSCGVADGLVGERIGGEKNLSWIM